MFSFVHVCVFIICILVVYMLYRFVLIDTVRYYGVGDSWDNIYEGDISHALDVRVK